MLPLDDRRAGVGPVAGRRMARRAGRRAAPRGEGDGTAPYRGLFPALKWDCCTRIMQLQLCLRGTSTSFPACVRGARGVRQVKVASFLSGVCRSLSELWQVSSLSRQHRVADSRESAPFVLRAGIEAPGTVSAAQKARKSGRESISSIFVCLRPSLRFSFAGGGAPHGQPRSGFRGFGTERSLGVWPSSRKLRRLSRCRKDGEGAAIALANPVYLAIADEASIRKVIAQRRCRHRDAGVRPKRWRNADRRADRRDHQQEIRSRWSRQGILDAASTLLLMRLNRRETRNEAKPHTKPSANLATDPSVAVDQKASAISR